MNTRINEQPSALADELVELREFLDGSGALDGLFFGDAREGQAKAYMARAQFWWRAEMNRRIDRALSALKTPDPQVAVLREALTEIAGFSEENGMTRRRMRKIARTALNETRHD